MAGRHPFRNLTHSTEHILIINFGSSQRCLLHFFQLVHAFPVFGPHMENIFSSDLLLEWISM